MSYDEEMQSEFNAGYDHRLGMYSALDPIQELAYDNDCGYDEMLEWLNRERTPRVVPELTFSTSELVWDDNEIPF